MTGLLCSLQQPLLFVRAQNSPETIPFSSTSIFSAAGTLGLSLIHIYLHFTGDFHAIGAANNLLAAMLDNHIQQGNALDIDVQIGRAHV